MKHLIETADLSSLTRVDYDRIILNSDTDDIIVRGGVTYEIDPSSYIYNEADRKYYQKLVGYGKPIKTNATVDLNSQWVSDTTDDKYKYFKSDSYNDGVKEVDGKRFSYSYSQCKVTWSNLTSITFKYTSNGDTGELFVLNMDSEKFTPSTSEDDIYLSLFDETPGTYNEFTIECDKGEHHIWFCYIKFEGATDEECGFIGVPKSVSPILDIKQGAELPMEYKYGGVSAEGGKTYNISFNNVTLPNDNIVTVYEDFQKVEKTITYEYVDLGLSVKWATCNIGATSTTEDGVLFQWGETSGVSETLVDKYSDENYSWESYTLCNGSGTTLTKYCSNSSYGTADNIETLESVDDAATQIMGNEWRMPTETECRELVNNTTKTWVENFNGSGVDGCQFTSKKDTSKYIFIPVTDKYADSNPFSQIWSSSANTGDWVSSASCLWVQKDRLSTLGYSVRFKGIPVRGVRA